MKRPKKKRSVKAVVIGVSTGGVEALRTVLMALPASFPLPVMVVAHIAPESGSGLARLLDDLCSIRVKEADEFETAVPGTVYLAPANYHLQVEAGGVLTLSVDAPVSYARPSADVLFETAAAAYGDELAGVILTGAGGDGARGLEKVRRMGGIVVVQHPDDAECSSMPLQSLMLVRPDYVVPLKDVASLLIELAGTSAHHEKECTYAE